MSDAGLESLIQSRGLKPAVLTEPAPPAPDVGNSLPTIAPSAVTGKELRVDIPGRPPPPVPADNSPAAVSVPFRLREGVDTSNMDSDFVARTQKLFDAMPANIRDQVEVTDAVRSRERQAKYYDAYQAGTGGLAAAPGMSRHDPERREALDLAHGPALNWLWSKEGKAALASAGLAMPFANDRVHLQKAGGASTAAVPVPAGTTTPEQAASIASGLDTAGLSDFIDKRGLRPAGAPDSRTQLPDGASPSTLDALGTGLTAESDAMTQFGGQSAALLAGVAKGALEVPLGAAQAVLPRSVMEPVEEQYRNMTASINNIGDEHPTFDFVGKLIGSTGAILLGAKALGPAASAAGIQAITPRLATAAWQGLGPVGRGAATGAALGGTQFYERPENESRLGFNARMFDATVGATLGLTAGMVARGVQYAATQLSDSALGRAFLPTLQATAGDITRNSERPLAEALDHYKRVERLSASKYGLRDAEGRGFDGFPSGVGASEAGQAEGFAQAITKALEENRAHGIETRRPVEAAAGRARDLLGLNREEGRFAEWQAAKRQYDEQLAAYNKAAAAHPLRGAFERNPGLEDQLRSTGSLPIKPDAPAPFVPRPVSAADYARTRTMLNDAYRRTRNTAAKTQIGMMLREVDNVAKASAADFGMSGEQFMRQAIVANRYYQENVAPLRQLFDGKTTSQIEAMSKVPMGGVTPAQFFTDVIRVIEKNDVSQVRDLAKTLGPRGRDNMAAMVAARALEAGQDGAVRPAFTYIQKHEAVLRELLGRDAFTQLDGMGKVADELFSRAAAGPNGPKWRKVADWSHSFGPALAAYAIIEHGDWKRAGLIMAALPAYHLAVNIVGKIHTAPLMRPMVARAATMRPGSKELSDFVDQMERRMRRLTVPVVEAASP